MLGGYSLVPMTELSSWVVTVRNEVAKFTFLHLSVSHSVHGGGLPQCMLGYHPPWDQAPLPWDQAPPRPGPQPGSRHPPQDQAPPPPHETATVADGTHPTGMHSCLHYWKIFSEYCISLCFGGCLLNNWDSHAIIYFLKIFTTTHNCA